MSDEPRKPGRPALGTDKKSVAITVRVQAARADEMYREASASGFSVPELFRRAVDARKPR